ncbi:cyclin-dependent kinase inhibitor 1 [Pelobates fuscus]|uniref:cyclin-dependent kinase inhibitor 1 n=1 Tax=Pelobates fuscus TaxID=191477 RepID=UPI002FE497DE
MLTAKAILLQAMGSNHKVCRNLFGPVDHEQLKNDYENNMKSEVEKATQKWNFDFANNSPLPGDYKWERTGYRKSENTAETDKENICQERPTADSPFLCERCQNSESIDSSGRKRKQTLITDYYNVKRRRSSSSPPRCSKP